ncbi:uncharacterized protein RHIMIDRAFT_267294 [Rhizopus microsporus ATCC 52813]|uniref:Tc1-like transposase DDE domain-containing protein n=2 Tax=Rhizopus microsporus TaxID=58291 RepID=A0A2G4SJM4_RHIZD|nr:uncharacterized protein RHIMIDRAFT_267294 [Rhizopus microsporus ATCC 52813]PHZ08963.1 hypothetical protein RHIMIDRAFT_267294 [Rhizopus microsporus ATCC 52813]
MDWDEEVIPFHLKTLTRIRQYYEKQGNEQLSSPELNPIEQFWAIVKNKVKRSSFEVTEDLATRITEAYNSVPLKHLQAFVQNSVNWKSAYVMSRYEYYSF